MTSSVELTQDLVRFRTINPPGDERACAERLASLLEDAGFAVDLTPFGEGRAQLVARIGGASRKPAIGFTGHLDTVPLGAQPWSVDPLAAEIKDGKLYGRGSSDMKSGVAAFVMAGVALAGKLANTPGVVMYITAGEETGCTGAAAMAREISLPRVGALVVAEPTGNQPLVGHKGALWLEAVTTGVTAHGSQGRSRYHRATGFRFQFRSTRRSRRPDAQCRYDQRWTEHQFRAGPCCDRHRHPHDSGTEPRQDP
jgi:succinyl-diaminopimelate desuccinylase